FVVGIYAYHSQRYQLAADHFASAEKTLYAATADRDQIYRLIGISYLYTGKPREGLAAMEQALDACLLTPGGRAVECQGLALGTLGWAQDRLGDKTKALEFFKQALQLWRHEGKITNEAITLSNMGGVYNELG